MDPTLIKYQRTRHLVGSRLGVGDTADHVGFSELRAAMDAGADVVVEEKIDGANSAVSFDERGNLMLQSRGHWLTGGPRERHFAGMKAWAAAHQRTLWDLFGDRYVCFGEWCEATHTVFYDALGHRFAEFDILDRRTGTFLDTETRHAALDSSPIVSVPVVARGRFSSMAEICDLVAPSVWRTPAWRDALAEEAAAAGVDPARAAADCDGSDLAEGLYVKVERAGEVTGRYKWVRGDFVQTMLDSGSHWLARPLIRNRVAAGVDLYDPTPARLELPDRRS